MIESEIKERLLYVSSKLGVVPRDEVGETLLSMLDPLWKLCPLVEEGKEKSPNIVKGEGARSPKRGRKVSALSNMTLVSLGRNCSQSSGRL